MGRHEQRQARKSATNEVARKMPVSWLLVTGTMAGLALLAVSFALLKHRRIEHVETGPDSKSVAPAGDSGNSAPVGSENAATTNDLAVDIDKAADHLNRGTELLAQAKIDEAVAQYKEAVHWNPEDEDAHYNLAVALGRQGNRQAAKAQYREALRIYPDYAEAHNNLGNLLVAEGKFDEAIEHFKAALKISSDNASAHNNVGNALARQGKVADAIPCFREAIRLKPDYTEAHYNLGMAYLTQKQIEEAISEFTGILRVYPDFAPAQRALLKARRLETK